LSLTIDGSYAVYNCVGDGSPADDCGLSDVLAVGSRSPKGDGLWEQSDLAGSLSEWTLDVYTDDYTNPCDDCAPLFSSSLNRALRGGSFRGKEYDVLTSYRQGGAASDRFYDAGFRCARSAR
jgi:formylglycine-generating enzyme required for sulfatase activity